MGVGGGGFDEIKLSSALAGASRCWADLGNSWWNGYRNVVENKVNDNSR